MVSSQNIQIVLDEVPDGLSGFNITVSLLDPEIAEITVVSFPGWNSMLMNSTFPVPSSSVWIKSLDGGNQIVPGAKNVFLGNITYSVYFSTLPVSTSQ
ncbi:cell surface protein [Methanosarcina lacustris Z-7289]|uniref:Cell surface protein n=1 Tax=Methanosarcina lacustris Z-7289 TaxID=1434111 RepID=A0A0E3WRN3_9EURY|nr:cell surface protein [Methanosarcina lacustris Z-7289]